MDETETTSLMFPLSKTNCVTEVLFAEGLERAKYLDDYLERNGTVVGPLHSLPLSLKDNFITAPHPASIGLAVYANEQTRKDALLVTMLRDLGAVFYVKTNVPTAMMMNETNINIWGETRNPIHKGLSPGGSSGRRRRPHCNQGFPPLEWERILVEVFAFPAHSVISTV